MRIIYIITGLNIGGAETIVSNLASEISRKGSAVKLLYLNGVRRIDVADGIEVVGLNLKKNPLGFIKALFKFKKIVKDFKPDVIHANMFHAIIFSRIARLFVRVPYLVCTEHSNNYHGSFRKNLEHFTDWLSDINTNVSELATNYFIQEGVFSKDKSITVYNGIDLNKFKKEKTKSLRKELNIDDKTFVFLNISRFNKAKNHNNLIKAFKIVNSRYSDTKLICVGDGELFESIKNLAESLDLSQSVLFTGAKKNTEYYYNTADCFVLSSDYEGFGIVLVEAMACELEVISTNCGGTKEILKNSPNNLVSINNEEELANKMIEIMCKPKEDRDEAGISNRKNIMKFSMNDIVNRWETIYRKEI